MKKDELAGIVKEIVAEIYERHPDLWDKFGNFGHEKTYEDNMHHFDNLDIAFQVNDPEVFITYSVWLNDVLTSRGVTTDIIIENYEIIIDKIENNLNRERVGFYQKAINEAVEKLSG